MFRLIKNCIRLIQLLSKVDINFSIEGIEIYYGNSYLRIGEGRIRIGSKEIVIDYDHLFEHCEEWFINASQEQRDIYIESIIKEVEESDVGAIRSN